MTEPHLTENSGPTELPLHSRPIAVCDLGADAIVSHVRQQLLSAGLGNAATIDRALHLLVETLQQKATAEFQQHQQTWAQKRADLQSELVQAQSLIHGQGERISHLEQALDQTLGSLHDLRLQLVDQQLLEAHLASTEEISNVQQQAITQLKRQLAQQQAATQDGAIAQDDKAPSPSEPVVGLSATSAADHSLVSQLETQLDQAQGQIQDFSQQIRDRQAAINQLETDLHRAHLALQEQQSVIDSLQNGPSPRLAAAPAFNRVSLPAAGRREEAVLPPFSPGHPYTVLQHACQELERERDQAQQRISTLESQIADMQEQILQQAQQASEFETAIQHWKERYRTTQTHLRQLWQFTERPDSNWDLPDLITALRDSLQAIEEANQSPQRATSNNRSPKIDLPEFLVRRRPRISP